MRGCRDSRNLAPALWPVPVVALQGLLAREPGVQSVVGVGGRVDVGLVLAVLLRDTAILDQRLG